MKNKFSGLLRALFVGLGIATCSVSSPVGAVLYDFGTLLSGTFQPSATFAQLSVSPTVPNVYDFRLEAYDLRSLFGSPPATSGGPAIGRLAVDTDPAVTKQNVLISNIEISWGTATVDSVKATNAGGPTGVWDFSFDFNNQGRLIEAMEWVKWTATFVTVSPVVFNDFALHVQRIPTTVEPDGSAWYTPTTPIPEPETYAMMLAGLGLMGWVARRRQRKEAASA